MLWKMLDRRELETLVAIVDTGSFDGAARKLHITPGAVSQRIKSLENSLGQPVLIRSLPPRITDIGEQVLQHARKAMLLHSEIEHSLIRKTQASGHTVSVAVNHDSLNCWFMDVIEAVQQDSPINMDVRVADNKSTLELLRRGEVLGAVTSVADNIPGCKSDRLGSLIYYGVCSHTFFRQHFGQNGITEESLATAPVICHDQYDDLAARYLKQLGISSEMTRVSYIPSTHLIMDGIMNNMGWAMMPGLFIEKSANKDILQILNPGQVTIDLYWKRWDLESETITRLEKSLFQIAGKCC